jgi:tight adherence protein C
MEVFLVKLLSFSSILLFVLGLDALRRGRTIAAQSVDNRPGLFAWFGSEIAAVGRFIEPKIDQVFPEETKRIQNNLLAGALNERLTVRDIRGLQGLLGVALLITATVFVLIVTLEGSWAIIAGLLLGLMGYYYPVAWLQRVAQQRKERITKELPFAIDLLTVAMEAGQDFGAAVRHLVREASGGPLQHEFDIMLRETGLGKSRIEAMRSMAARMQIEEFNAVVTAVVQSTEMGASVAVALKLQADEIRRMRFHRAERKAARAPSLMLIPVALFILPSVFIIILTPVAMRMMNTLHNVR